MLKLNRTTEYGLIALTYIRGKSDGALTSAREVADHFDLPFEILAKTLQRLKDQGVITSTYGTRGGYVLSRNLETISLSEFLKMMEGPVCVVACQNPDTIATEHDCGYRGSCNILPMMTALNNRFSEFLNHISLEELTRMPAVSASSHTSNTAELLPESLQGGEP